jgi:hypothetical protein
VAGFAASCGGLLALAGVAKLYRGARRLNGDSAIRHVLRIPRPRWRRVEPVAGGIECATGALVCAGGHPVAAGSALAAFGLMFCALLGYVRASRVPGGCGCLNWRKAADTDPAPVTWRSVARGGTLTAAGIASATVPGGGAGAFSPAWVAGLLTAGAILQLLSAPLSTRPAVRTPACHRPLWRPARATLRALTGHETFTAMAASAGPFGSTAGYRRAGCAEQFWFPAAGDNRRAVVFQVRHVPPARSLAVHASLRPTHGADAAWPSRTVSVPRPAPARATRASKEDP